jgi:SHS2 domain-containing protein
LEKAFENGAKALFSVMVDLDTVKAATKVTVDCSAYDYEGLFIEWLNTLLSEMDLRRMLFSTFSVTLNSYMLHGEAFGEKIDRNKHVITGEVKAATYSSLKLEEKNGKMIQCIVDV